MRYYCCILFLILTSSSLPIKAQDTSYRKWLNIAVSADSATFYDSIFSELDSYLDSLSKPKSFLLVDLSVGNGFYNFKQNGSVFLAPEQRLVITPTVGCYHRSGLGLTATGYSMTGAGGGFYQAAITPGYDYARNRNLRTGITYTRYWYRNDLNFYTTPLNNELYGYFVWKKWWLKPAVAASFGWGTRTEVEKQEVFINTLRLRRTGVVVIENEEKVQDLSLLFSVRHDFFKFDLLRDKDVLRFTPSFIVTAGTQRFGLNSSSKTYLNAPIGNVLYRTEEAYLDDRFGLDWQSCLLSLRLDYTVGKWYIQPQLLLDYYLHASSKRLNAIWTISSGVVF